MPECNHCDAAFETDEELAAHLVESHEWDDLSAIDRRLVETYQPAGTPDATMSAKLARAVGSVPGANRFNRRQVLALFAGAVALSGTGAVVNWWSNADDIDTESLTGVWEHGPELPISAEYPAVTAYDDQLYVLGGGDEDQNSQSEAYLFDPATESWSELASMPVAARRTSASVVEDRIYIVDGSTANNSHGDGTVRIYDPDDDSWSQGATRPVASRDPGQATDGDQIYVFGGNRRGNSIDAAHAYDPELNEWRELSPLPFPNRQFSCHYLPEQERIYMFGGESPGGRPERDDVITYDPTTDTYDDSPTDMPEPSQTIPSTVYDGKVLFAGGEEPGGTTGATTFRVYDPGKDAYETLPELLEMVEATDAAVIDDTLYVPGGRTYFEPDADLDAEPHQYRYEDFPVFHDRMQMYRFDS